MLANFEDLEIDDEFKKLIPHLTEEEENALAESIGKFGGCYTPLIAWRDKDGILWLLDGHHRFHICRRFKFIPEVRVLNFEDRNEAMLWMIEHQLSRRNLTLYQKGKLAILHENTVAERAKKDCIGRDNPVNTGKELAEGYGIGRATYYKIKKIEELASDEEKEQLSSGKTTINALNNKLKRDEKQIPSEESSNPGVSLLLEEEGQEASESDQDIDPKTSQEDKTQSRVDKTKNSIRELSKVKDKLLDSHKAQLRESSGELIGLLDYVPEKDSQDAA